MSASISFSVRYSRVRRSAFLTRRGMTVRFAMAGVTSLRCDLSMFSGLPVLMTVRTKPLLQTVASSRGVRSKSCRKSDYACCVSPLSKCVTSAPASTLLGAFFFGRQRLGHSAAMVLSCCACRLLLPQCKTAQIVGGSLRLAARREERAIISLQKANPRLNIATVAQVTVNGELSAEEGRA